MAKQTIIDWQKDSLLAASCSGRADNPRLDALSLQAIAAGTEGAHANASAAMKQLADDMGLGKSNVTLIAPRSCVEVRTISVPRIDADELPDVIRFQAQRQLANMGDSWTLDFVLLPDDPTQEMRTALVGAIAPQQLTAMREACAAANLQLSHVALRPIEIARYALSAAGNAQAGAFLIVCLTDRTADLILVRGGQVLLLRSTQVPSEPAAVPQAIGGEIRRSLLAASAQLGSTPIEGCVLIAAPVVAGSVEQVIADTLDISVTVLDPTGLLPADQADREQLGLQSAGRLAAIAGATSVPIADRASVIDFQNPKKRPPPKKKTKLYVLAGVAAVLLLGAGFSWWTRKNRELDQDLAAIQEEIDSKQQLVEISKQKVSELKLVEQFLAGSPNFLDELVVIAAKMPPAEQVIVEEPQFNVLSDGSGRLRFNMKADTAETIAAFENALRAEDDFQVEGRDNRASANPTPLYKWEVTELITIPNRGWKLLEDAAEKPTPASTDGSDATEPPATDEEAAGTASAPVTESDDAPPMTTESPVPTGDDAQPAPSQSDESDANSEQAPQAVDENQSEDTPATPDKDPTGAEAPEDEAAPVQPSTIT